MCQKPKTWKRRRNLLIVNYYSNDDNGIENGVSYSCKDSGNETLDLFESYNSSILSELDSSCDNRLTDSDENLELLNSFNLLISCGSEPRETNLTHLNNVCYVCDKEFSTTNELNSHSVLHIPTSTSPLVTEVEESIFQKIVNEETENSPVVVEPIPAQNNPLSRVTHLKRNLVEDLLTSNSPDDLILKSVISNEIPEDYEAFTKIREKPGPKNNYDCTSLIKKRLVSKAIVKFEEPMAMISDKNYAKRKVQINSPSVRKSKRRKVDKEIQPPPSSSSDGNDDDYYIPEEADANVQEAIDIKEVDIEFENLVNDKIYKILSSRNEQSKTHHCRSFKNDKVNFNITVPNVISLEVKTQPEELMYLGKNLPFKVPSPSKDRLKYFTSLEKYYDEKYFKIQEEWSQAQDKEKVYRRRRGKRGALGFALGMELRKVKLSSKKPNVDDICIANESIKSEEIENELISVEGVSVEQRNTEATVDVDLSRSQIDERTVDVDLCSIQDEHIRSGDQQSAQNVNSSLELEDNCSMPVFDF